MQVGFRVYGWRELHYKTDLLARRLLESYMLGGINPNLSVPMDASVASIIRPEKPSVPSSQGFGSDAVSVTRLCSRASQLQALWE